MAGVGELESSYLADTSTSERRTVGATFTPQWVVDLMLRRVAPSKYSIVIDAGAGPGRFAVSAARRLPQASVVAIENDAALTSGLRAVVRESLEARRISVTQADFLDSPLPYSGPRLFLGNPPYVRHHLLSPKQKRWLREAAEQLGQPLSGLSGLHIYFLARILLEARRGDALLMILPSEWLETRYGNAIKASMLERCSGIRLLLFDPRTHVFADAMTTSVILELKFGGRTRVLDVVALDDRMGARQRQAKAMLPEEGGASSNWLSLAWNALNPAPRAKASARSMIELGDVFAIHRGQVTGMNAVWIATSETAALVPDEFLHPSVTDAREILQLEDGVLHSTATLRRVIDLPADLRVLGSRDRARVERFLSLARAAGAANGYIARHRRPWWRVGLKEPPALVMTYMARRPPRFAVNRAAARLINIAHGLYPRQKMSEPQLLRIARWLNTSALGRNGRTYAGGLIKLEPGDASRIRIPDPRVFELAA